MKGKVGDSDWDLVVKGSGWRNMGDSVVGVCFFLF